MGYIETSALKNATIMLLYAERDEIDVNPEYQRSGGIWTLSKKRLLIDSIINDYDIPKLYFHDLTRSDSTNTTVRYSVIDGRQRLEAIWGFMDGLFTLDPEFEYQRDPSVQMGGYSYEDIAKKYPKIRIKFDSFVLPIVLVEVSDDDLELIEDMFSRLNEAVPLNAAEKRNALGGDMVAAVNHISRHMYFQKRVKFNDARYKHREVAARLLLVEDSLSEKGSLIDTKREYLDGLVKTLKSGNAKRVNDLRNRVEAVLDDMANIFVDKDELLSAQGIQTVYYLLFRGMRENGEPNKIGRPELLEFRNKLSKNRDLAATQYEEATFDLLEFERLNQQGTNDASSIKERYLTICRHLGLKPDPALENRPTPLPPPPQP